MNLPNMLEAKKRTKNKTLIKYDDYFMNEELESLGKDKNYIILTYGCQMNEHDSENIAGIMEDMSYTKVLDMEDADVIIVNTCAIRENAHNKAEGMLGRIKHLKETKKDIIVILCGCMAQEEGLVNKINNYKWIDIICGTHNYHKIPEYLLEIVNNQDKLMREVFSIEGDVIENLPVKRESKYTGWVNIQYGCDKFCTYCIVPYTRGKQRSRLPEDIIDEVREMYNNCYQEVTLLGQNVNAYGKDLDMEYDFADLLGEVSQTGIPRIRFVTSHPWDFTDKMIDVISKCDNIMPYVHLPIQSGSDRILKLMGRKYTKEEYLELVNKIRERVPNVSITTDIIVGFPGETEEDFQDTLDIVNKVKYDLAYTFIYSPREGTPAAKMEDNTPMEEKKERLARLNELINKYALEANKKMLDKIVSVLILGESDKENKYMGYTDNMKLVNVACDKELVGKIINVKIVDAKTWSLEGVVNDK
ncbi:MAG: tRNA (N6-isopentenyl adenosine(37)-C2)-methylthiotransferase MiaB [Bacilli bacterium]|nr:tRNA (N6-isopentenyl adenosine(37)-C2)-methylthiotransferase MiaB [Bacilli bacterium]